jgi:hypothetical protein
VIWNPWRRIRELEAQAIEMECQFADLEDAFFVLERSLHHANDRYDRIRDANLQLRDALDLYRPMGSA